MLHQLKTKTKKQQQQRRQQRDFYRKTQVNLCLRIFIKKQTSSAFEHTTAKVFTVQNNWADTGRYTGVSVWKRRGGG